MKTIIPFAAIALSALALPVSAQSAGDWTIGLGLASVMPKDGNGTLTAGAVDVGNDLRPSITVEYFIRDNIGVELLAATPFKHDVSVGGGKIGTVKHLPPVVSLNYHWDTGSAFQPYAGVGVNFTGFWDEKTTGALAGSELSLKNSWGLAAQVGADWWLNERAALRGTVRWIDIDSDVYLNGAKIGTAEVDPLVVQAAYVMRF